MTVSRFEGVGAITEFGRAPISHFWRDRILELNGEFRRSSADEVLRNMVEGCITLVSAVVIFTSCLHYARVGSDVWLYLDGLSLVTVGLARRAASKNGMWYQFQQGSVSAFSARGKLLWREDLSGLKAVYCTRGRAVTCLALRWPDRTRSMEFYASLEAALCDFHRDR